MNNKKDNEKNENTKQKKRNSKVAKIVAICTIMGVFASAIVGLSVALYYAESSVKTHETYQRQMDAVYRRAYYDLLDGASDLGVNLRKISVSNSPSMQQSLLYEVWNSAQLAEDNLGMFGGNDDGILKAQQFVNQLGDFAHTLALKIARGEKLSVDDRTTLQKLGEVADMYSKALAKVQSDLDDANLKLTDANALDTFVGAFEAFSEPSFDYPEMIYDGPFSSALEDKHPKGLTGEDINSQKGEELLKKYLPNAKDIKFIEESEGSIATLDYSFTFLGFEGYAQLSKKGGMLIMLSINETENNVSNNEADSTCQQKAIEFASRLGFDDMQVVWSCASNGECVVNLAPMQDGAVLYSDLVKVKISQTGKNVIGFDASHYAYNHAKRDISPATIDEKQARKMLSVSAISEGKLALIPLRETQEVLTYEFECSNNGTYYIYIDAHTGEEVNVLYVISDEMGERTI